MTTLTATVEGQYVALMAQSVPPSVGRARFMRSVGRDRQMVRGGLVSVAGAAALFDYYPPLGCDVSYEIETESGQVLASAIVKVPSQVGVLRDALHPDQSVEIHTAYHAEQPGTVLSDTSFRERAWQAQGELVEVVGARLPVWLGEVSRANIVELTTYFHTRDLDTVKRLLEQPVLCVQALSDWGLSDPVMYTSTDASVFAYKPNNTDELMRLDLIITPVRPPSVSAQVADVFVSTVDSAALDAVLTVANVDANASGASVAEVHLHPQILLGAG